MLDNLSRHTSRSVRNPENSTTPSYEKLSGSDAVTPSKPLSETHLHSTKRADGGYTSGFSHPRSTRETPQSTNYATTIGGGPLTASLNADGENDTVSSTHSLDLEHALLESGAQTTAQRASLPALRYSNNLSSADKNHDLADGTPDHLKDAEPTPHSQPDNHTGNSKNLAISSDAAKDNSDVGTDRFYGQKRMMVNAPKSWKGRLLGPMEPMELSSVSKKTQNSKPSRNSQVYGLPRVYDVPRGVSSLMKTPLGPSLVKEPEQKLPSLTEDSRLAHAVANDPVGPRFTATTPDYHHAAVMSSYEHRYNGGPDLGLPRHQDYAVSKDQYPSNRLYDPPESRTAGHELTGREYAPVSVPLNGYPHSQSYPQIHPNHAMNKVNVRHSRHDIQLNGSQHPHTGPPMHQSSPNLVSNGSLGGSLVNNGGVPADLSANSVGNGNGYAASNGIPLNYNNHIAAPHFGSELPRGHVSHDITKSSTPEASHLNSRINQDQPPVVAYPVLFVPNSQRFGNSNGHFEPPLPEYAKSHHDPRHKDHEHARLTANREAPGLPHPLQAIQGYQAPSSGSMPMASHHGVMPTNFQVTANGVDSGGQLDDPTGSANQRSVGETKSHHCTYPGCNWSFARSSDYKRHLRSHGQPSLRCPYWQVEPACGKKAGLFYRLDVLKRHLKLVHSIRSTDGTNDGGECRVCSQHFDTAREFIDHCEKCAQDKSEALGHLPQDDH